MTSIPVAQPVSTAALAMPRHAACLAANLLAQPSDSPAFYPVDNDPCRGAPISPSTG